jgi:choline dehydrogenase
MTDAPLVSDYVAVGAGSAGSVIVRRLLAAGRSVHVIEAGATDTGPAIHSPQGWPSPLADPNVLGDPADLEAMVEAVEMCRDIGSSAAFARWRNAEVAPGRGAATRADIRELVKRSVGTYRHQVRTCRMGSPEDVDAVVGPDFRVRGIENLRVADASIMPTVTSGTKAPTIMIGERADDLLLGSREITERVA